MYLQYFPIDSLLILIVLLRSVEYLAGCRQVKVIRELFLIVISENSPKESYKTTFTYLHLC